MAVRISRREVLNNIIRLKDQLLEQKEEREERKPEILENRWYTAFLNRQTGDIRFNQEIDKFRPREEWIEIRIQVEVRENKSARFDARNEKNQPFKTGGLAPLARRIVVETLETLNSIAREHPPKTPDILPEEAALEDLSEIHLSEIKDTMEEMPGWCGEIDRIKAEKKLQNQPLGTYLLHGTGPITRIVVLRLSDSNQMTVKACLITIKDIDKKISEQLILQTDLGWTIYRNNPNLKDLKEYTYFNSLPEALRNLELRAKTPLKD
jgi:hypothetical protein